VVFFLTAQTAHLSEASINDPLAEKPGGWIIDELITEATQITPDWLMRVLGNKSVLDRGAVLAVHQEWSRSTLVSNIYRLRVSYSDDAPRSSPSWLLLKTSRADLDPQTLSTLGRKEVTFYNTLAATMVDPPTVRCYDAVYSPESGKSHILLDDLSETHFQPEWPLPPCQLYCEQAVDCLARVHAHWWEDPRLGNDIGQLLDAKAAEDAFQKTCQMVSRFLSFMGDRLSRERKKLIELALSSLPKLWKRITEGKGLTIIHGDAHHWNFLYPHDSSKGRIYIIDWQLWKIRPGTNDLAYMIALFWYPERRADLEKDLVKRYQDGLAANGLEGYTWDDCWHDYRLSVINHLFTPIWQWANNIPARIWWSNFEKIMLAFRELDCVELL